MPAANVPRTLLCYTRPVAPKHLFRDPDSIPRSKHGTERDLAQIGTWTLAQREQMDERFAAAMLAAGYGSTMPSTTFGARNPIAGYLRSDYLAAAMPRAARGGAVAGTISGNLGLLLPVSLPESRKPRHPLGSSP